MSDAVMRWRYTDEAAVLFPWIGVVCVVRWLRSIVDWADQEA